MTASVVHVWRLLKWGRILARHGALRGIERDPNTPAPVRRLARVARIGARVPAVPRYADAFQAIGPAAIKLGQTLATRPDLIGDEAAHDLMRLQDALPPVPFETIREQLRLSFGRPIEDLFASIDEAPIGAASIAATRRDAQDAAVAPTPAPAAPTRTAAKPNILIIVADDLTGAADCGAVCAAAGLETVVAMGEAGRARELAVDVMAFDADTRQLAPSAAANLARLTHAPDITLIYESGTLATKPDVLPLSIGDGELCETALTTVSVPEMFRYWLQGGRITVGFLGGAQIDRFANLNTTVVGDYDRPKVRLPGGGGAPEIATACGEVYIIMKQSPRTFVDRLDFVTSLGHGKGGDAPEGELAPQPAAIDDGIGIERHALILAFSP